MPTLKELRAELKKSMKPIGKMSRDEVVLMLEKHKPDTFIPKTELVDVLEKPKKLKEKKEELKVMKVKVPMVKYASSSEDEEVKPVKVMKKKVLTSEAPMKPVKVMKKKVLSSEAPVKEKTEEVSDKRKQWAELRRSGKSSAEAWAIIKGQ